MITEMQDIIDSATDEQKSNFMFARASEMILLCNYYIDSISNSDQELTAELKSKIIRLSDSERDIRSDFHGNNCVDIVSSISELGRVMVCT